MASGVKVDDDVNAKFNDIKTKKKHRYCVFHIKDEKVIVVETVGPREADYQAFLDDLMSCGEADCRYGLFDFEYAHQCEGTSEKTTKQKLCLMIWCPDTAKIKKKMLYSSSFDALKKGMIGVSKFIQATDASEASAEAVLEKLKQNDRV